MTSRHDVLFFVVVFVCLYCEQIKSLYVSTIHQVNSKMSLPILTRSSATRLYDASESNSDPSPCGLCPKAPKCNGEFLSQGCDGTGKVLGGLASVPGFSWFPAKVYRPCPSYLKAGYVYRREGQTMDQVLFSEPSQKMKEKLAAMRASEWQEKQQQQQQQSSVKDVSGSSNPDNVDAASKLLNEKYGKK